MNNDAYADNGGKDGLLLRVLLRLDIIDRYPVR